MFAPAATDAVFRLHFRDLELLVHRIRVRHHVHRFRRTVLGTRAAELRELLIFQRQRQHGAAGANVHADRALKVAVARVEVHPRLHDA